jgi:hypothetical protein
MTYSLIPLCAAFTLAACHSGPGPQSPDSVPANPKFEQDIKPILQKQCVACHNRQSLPDRWSVENAREANLIRPNVGPMIIPGFPEKSPLITAITLSYEHAHAMPPLSVHVSPSEVETLRRWIAQGADWPEGKAGAISPPPVKLPY